MVRIITDSVSDLSDEQILQYGVDAVLHLKILFGNEHFIDGIDITKEEFFQKLSVCKELPKTSLVTPAEFSEVFDRFIGDQIVVITLSGALSGTYQSAVIAKESSERDDIWVVDSRNATLALGLLVIEACKMRDNGMSGQQISDKIEKLKERVTLFAVLDTLKYLKMGGRLSAASAIAGTLLNVKPVITVKNGEVLAAGKAKGLNKAYEFILDKINQEKIDKNYTVTFAGAHCPERVSQYAKNTSEILGLDNTVLIDIGATVGVHVGEGGHGIAYIRAD